MNKKENQKLYNILKEKFNNKVSDNNLAIISSIISMGSIQNNNDDDSKYMKYIENLETFFNKSNSNELLSGMEGEEIGIFLAFVAATSQEDLIKSQENTKNFIIDEVIDESFQQLSKIIQSKDIKKISEIISVEIDCSLSDDLYKQSYSNQIKKLSKLLEKKSFIAYQILSIIQKSISNQNFKDKISPQKSYIKEFFKYAVIILASSTLAYAGQAYSHSFLSFLAPAFLGVGISYGAVKLIDKIKNYTENINSTKDIQVNGANVEILNEETIGKIKNNLIDINQAIKCEIEFTSQNNQKSNEINNEINKISSQLKGIFVHNMKDEIGLIKPGETPEKSMDSKVYLGVEKK